ncbi:MAG: hypothetical protein EA359_15995 [Balneolaceae bacterium]|nr:MAG: hypothetical protein EA359_15995 [Balneolaceae bacterium]
MKMAAMLPGILKNMNKIYDGGLIRYYFIPAIFGMVQNNIHIPAAILMFFCKGVICIPGI